MSVEPPPAAATTVLGAEDSFGAFEIVPDTDPEVAPEIYLNSTTVGFIQSMPVTKRVRRVTVGDISMPPCDDRPPVQLYVYRYPSGTWGPAGGGDSVEVGRSQPIVLPESPQQVGFDVPGLLLREGEAYGFSLYAAAGVCSKISLRSWQHNGAVVNSGSERCAAVPEIVDGDMTGLPRRMWHVKGADDRHPDCATEPYEPWIFDPSMPTGWLVTIDGAYRHVTGGSTTGEFSPDLCSVDYVGGSRTRGLEAAHWYDEPLDNGEVSHHFVCRFTQYPAPDVSVPDGWYHGFPWLGSRQGRPRDTYIGLNAYNPTRPEYYGLGAGGASDYQAAPNLPRCYAGDPVNCATGNFAEAYQDLAIGGRGVGLKLARTYNSQAAEDAEAPGPFGYGWSLSFGERLTTASDGVVTVHHDDGSTASFTPAGDDGAYSAAGWVQAVLRRQADGSFTYTLPDRRVMGFTDAGRLEWVEDHNGNRTSLEYASGRLERITDPAGRAITLEYNSSGRVQKATAPAGEAVTYGYSGGELTSVTDVGGGGTRFGYDASHRMTSVTDARGKTTTNAYDAAGRVIRQTDPLDRTRTWDWSTPGETRITDPAGHVTVQRFKHFLPVSVTRAAGTADEATWLYRHDQDGNLVLQQDPNGHTQRFTYDSRGNRTSATDALGHTTEWTYDDNRNVTSETTPEGRQTRLTYDWLGNLDTIQRTLNETGETATTTLYHDYYGQLLTVTDPLNRTTRYDYNTQGDRTSVTTPEGHTTTATYDIAGRQTGVTTARGNAPGADPADFTTVLTRDAFGQPTDIKDPLGRHTLLDYDSDQNLVEHTDRDGRITRFTYDAAGQQTKVTRPDGTEVATGYGAAGRGGSHTDGLNRATRFGYDAQGRLDQITDPLDRTTSFGYDDAGNRIRRTDARSRTTSYAYDDADRLTGINYSSGTPSAVSITYNADDQRLTVEDGTGITRYAYDSLGRIKSHTSGAGQTTSYGYDLADQAIAVRYPAALPPFNPSTQDSQRQVQTGTVTRAYDPDGNLASVTDWLEHTSSFEYDAEGHLTGVTRPNGTSAAYDHDANGALTGLTDLGDQTALGRTAESLLASSTPPVGNPEDFGYDLLGRLTSAGGSTYAYDSADNLTRTNSASGQPIAQAFDAANQLTSASQSGVATTTFEYNASGNRIGRTQPDAPATAYGYDQADQLTSYSGPDHAGGGTLTASYTYDADGLRQTATTGGVRRNMAYDLSTGLATVITDGATAYVTGPGGLPIEQIAADGTVRYFHHDQLGSTTTLSDQSGARVASYDYDPHGNPTSAPPTGVENPFRFWRGPRRC